LVLGDPAYYGRFGFKEEIGHSFLPPYTLQYPFGWTGMMLKNIAIGLNVLLMLLCVGFFVGHGLPKSLMLWSSAILWFVAPLVNLLYIRKNS